MTTERPTRPRDHWAILSWLVGLAVLAHFVIIPLANLLEFVPLRDHTPPNQPPIITPQKRGQFTENETLQGSVEAAGDAVSMWLELTGLEQGWTMFTPGFPPQTVLPAVEVRLANSQVVQVLSRFEDRTMSRWPMLHTREFNLECSLVLVGWEATPERIAQHPEIWQQTPQFVRDNHSLIMNWLKFKANQVQTQIGSTTVTEATLLLRCFSTPAPNQVADPRYEWPLARLKFNSKPDAGMLPLEGFDPVRREFVPLPVWGEP